MYTCGTGKATSLNCWPSRQVLHPCQQMQQRCSPKPPPMHADLPCRIDPNPAAHQDHHVHHQDLLPGPTHVTHIMGHHKILSGSMQRTWHSRQLSTISLNSASMDVPADGEIFGSNHLGEIADIQSKLVQNLVKVGKTYHHLHTQLLNPSSEELSNFLVSCERDFDSHLHHILHLDDLLARDARHHIQLGYPVFNYPRYIPTM